MRRELRVTFEILLLLTAVFTAAATASAADDAGQPASVLPHLNQLTGAEQAAGWKLLFDGQTTNGWRNFKKADVSQGWQVIDGALCRVNKSAGDIISNEQYDNFVLELDYKVPPHANSGLMFRVSEDEGRTWKVSRVLGPGISGYSDLAAAPDGTVYCFYERGGVEARMFHTQYLTVARFPVSWLDGE